MHDGAGKSSEKYYRNIKSGARSLCTFSGGKDSGLALGKALEAGEVFALIHVLINGQTLYHEQPRTTIESQAEAIGISLEPIDFKWWRNQARAVSFLENWKSVGVDCVVFGDLHPRYMLSGHVPVCEPAGIAACAPICGADYDHLIDEIERLEIKSLVTKINDRRIDRHWLGEPFSREMYLEFKSIGIDAFGENDEFHTTLVEASFFKKPLEYSLRVVDDYNLIVCTR